MWIFTCFTIQTFWTLNLIFISALHGTYTGVIFTIHTTHIKLRLWCLCCSYCIIHHYILQLHSLLSVPSSTICPKSTLRWHFTEEPLGITLKQPIWLIGNLMGSRGSSTLPSTHLFTKYSLATSGFLDWEYVMGQLLKLTKWFIINQSWSNPQTTKTISGVTTGVTTTVTTEMHYQLYLTLWIVLLECQLSCTNWAPLIL